MSYIQHEIGRQKGSTQLASRIEPTGSPQDCPDVRRASTYRVQPGLSQPGNALTQVKTGLNPLSAHMWKEYNSHKIRNNYYSSYAEERGVS